MTRPGLLLFIVGGAIAGCSESEEASSGERSMFMHGLCLGGWCWEQPAPFGRLPPYPQNVWAASSNEAWAVTDPELHHWTGTGWTATEGGFTGPIDGSARDNVVVGTETGAMHYDGSAWRTMTDCPRPRAIWVAGLNDVWLAGAPEEPFDPPSITLWRWNGDICTAFQTFEHATSAVIDGSDPDHGWLAFNTRDAGPPVVTGAQVFRWDGSTWTQTLEPGSVANLVAVSASQAWLSADRALWRWDGSEWTRLLDADVYGMWFASPTDGWATTGSGVDDERSGDILHWDGTTWTGVHTMSEYPIGLFGVSRTEVMALAYRMTPMGGNGGVDIAFWDGSQWSDWSHRGEESVMTHVAVGRNGEAWAVSEDALYRRTGQGWERVAEGGGTAISSGASGEVWVMRESGLHRWDGQWREVAMPDTDQNPVVSIWAINRDDVFVATSRTLHKRGRTGWQWSKDAPDFAGEIRTVHGAGVDDVWILGRGGVARLVDGDWRRVNLAHCGRSPDETFGFSLEDLWVAAPDTAYIVGLGSYRFSDVGEDGLHVWRTDPTGGNTCTTNYGSHSPKTRIAACNDEAWVVVNGNVGRFVDGRWTYRYMASTLLDVACHDDSGFLAVGRDGVVLHRPPQ